MKTLCVRQPLSSFIVYGIKTIEKRTWSTNYRGRILIHASGDAYAWPDANFLEDIETYKKYEDVKDLSAAPTKVKNYKKLLEYVFKFYDQDYVAETNLKWLKEKVKEKGFALDTKRIVGSVELFDIQKTQEGYNWILKDPVVFDKPIINVIGRLRLWNFEGGS